MDLCDRACGCRWHDIRVVTMYIQFCDLHCTGEWFTNSDHLTAFIIDTADSVEQIDRLTAVLDTCCIDVDERGSGIGGQFREGRMFMRFTSCDEWGRIDRDMDIGFNDTQDICVTDAASECICFISECNGNRI